MCGIFGFFGGEASQKEQLKILASCINSLEHRGPDSIGIWHSNNIYLGHTRLAITELSMAGQQPMVSSSGNYVITLNGEIYNHLGIRRIIQNEFGLTEWSGDSDTETLLRSIEIYGLRKTLEMIDGMFAFSVYDKKNNTISLVRDGAGEKPLYYGLIGNQVENIFIFSSDLCAIKKHPEFKSHLIKSSIVKFFENGYIESPNSIYKGIYKLSPGEMVSINLDNFSPNEFLLNNQTINELAGFNKIKYLKFKSAKNHLNEYEDSKILKLKLKNTLVSSIRAQLLAKVQIGAFLSGGIDSSLIVAMMLKECNAKFEVFTVGYADSKYDESLYAEKIANYLGVNFNKLSVSRQDIVDVIKNKYINIYTEPFADESGIPTYLICALAKKKASVMLGGDGADELFGGYSRYVYIEYIWKLRGIICNIYVLRALKFLFLSTGKFINISRIDEKLDKLSNIKKDCLSFEDFYCEINKIWKANDDLFVNSSNDYAHIQPAPQIKDKKRLMMSIDFARYMPDDVLCKVDRASMASGLRTRSPFLSRDMISFAHGISTKSLFKNDKAGTKCLLRDLLSDYLPKIMFERPKMGFGVPLDSIFRNELREFIYKMLEENKLKNEGFFNEKTIAKVLDEHMNQGKNRSRKIWTLLVFQMWMERERGEFGHPIICS